MKNIGRIGWIGFDWKVCKREKHMKTGIVQGEESPFRGNGAGVGTKKGLLRQVPVKTVLRCILRGQLSPLCE